MESFNKKNLFQTTYLIVSASSIHTFPYNYLVIFDQLSLAIASRICKQLRSMALLMRAQHSIKKTENSIQNSFSLKNTNQSRDNCIETDLKILFKFTERLL